MESNIAILLPTFSKMNFAIPKYLKKKISACVNCIFLMLQVTNIYWDKINSCYFFNVWTWKKVEIYTIWERGEVSVHGFSPNLLQAIYIRSHWNDVNGGKELRKTLIKSSKKGEGVIQYNNVTQKS